MTAWPAVVLVTVVVLDRAARDGVAVALRGIADSVAVTALLVTLAVPLVAAASRGRPPLDRTDARWLVGSLLLAATGLRVAGWLPTASFNWDGLITAAVVTTLMIAALPGLTWTDAGLTRPTEGGWLRPTLVMTAAVLGYVLALNPGGRPLGGEELLVNLTMPGLAEELLFRGLLLGKLDVLLGRPWTLWGARWGWGLVISTVVFTALHIVRLDLTFTPSGIATIVIGFGLGWIRERSGSVVPAIAAHNLWNTVGLAL